MRWRRKPSEADYLSALDDAFEDPEGQVHVLFEVARSRHHQLAEERMSRWDPRRWFLLDRARLDRTWFHPEPVPRQGWRSAIDDPAASTLLVVLASTHSDGFIREHATVVLAARREGLATAALAVRAADHVEEVRAVARYALLSRTTPTDAEIATPILLAARERRVVGEFFETYVSHLPEGALRGLRRSADRDTRRFAVLRAPLSTAELVDIARTEADMTARLGAARRALEIESTARSLLELRPAAIRALAFEAIDESAARAMLPTLLLDRSTQLRRAARRRAAELGEDVRAFYRAHLPGRTAVLGLGEAGRRTDAGLLRELVASEATPSVRRAAIIAFGRLADLDDLREVLPPLVHDTEPLVAREAARRLRRVHFRLTWGAFESAIDSEQPWTRQAALTVARGAGGWEVPVAALVLYDDPDERVRESAQAALSDWFRRRSATAGLPSAAQATRLEKELARLRLPEHLEQHLRFNAGLPR